MVPARPFFIGSRAACDREPGFGSSHRPRIQGFVRRIEIKAHDIFDFSDKTFVVRQLKGLDQMRLEAVRIPNPLQRSCGWMRAPWPACGHSVRCGRRVLMQGHLDRRSITDARVEAFARDALRPAATREARAPHSVLAGSTVRLHLLPPNDRHLCPPGLRQQHNSDRQTTLRRIAVRHPTLQCRPILRDSQMHPASSCRRLAPFGDLGILCLVPEH